MDIEKTVAQLMQKIERHFLGKYRGFVVDNEDPESLGRLKIKVPSILGNDVVTGWALPCMPYGGDMNQGMLFIPTIGAGVWIEFEEGDLEFPVWVGTFWSKPEGDSELPKANNAEGVEEDNVQSPVTRKIIKTLKGHTIQFEDKDGEEMITIIQNTDADGQNVITLNNSGITVTDFTGNKIEMSDSAFSITSAVDFTIDASDNNVEIIASAIEFTKS